MTICFLPRASAATLHVPADYPTIQSCIDAAVSGHDECVVAPGTYNELINFLGKAITLRSSHGPAVTTIDGTGLNGSVVRFVNREGRSSILEGFTITGGNANGPGFPNDGGGGIFCDRGSPTINNCVITQNTTTRLGGGIYLYRDSKALITNSIISNNSASHGGGILCWLSNATIRQCTISRNTAWFGCGVWLGDSDAVIEQCLISENFGGLAGGIDLNGDGNPVVRDCVITQNVSDDRGGGIWSTSANGTIINSIISGNSADYGGGGIAGGETLLKIDNCIIAENSASQGGGVHCWADGHMSLVNTTIVGNHAASAGAVHCSADGTVQIDGCIIWNNSYRQLLTSQQSKIFVRYSDVQGGWAAMLGDGHLTWGPGAIDVDPLLNGPINNLYHLAADSPCVNTSDPSNGGWLNRTDLDGEPRLFGAHRDMGADEYNDCNFNGVADYLDIGSGESNDCTDNRMPDECEADCNANGAADTCDVSEGASIDCAGDEVPDECEFDCNGNGDADSCDIASGVSADCNGNGVPDECLSIEGDCDANGSIDQCDTASGKVEDCNRNGIPDSCDDTTDCNKNGVFDACELLEAGTKDTDQDGIIDECETQLIIYVDEVYFHSAPAILGVNNSGTDGTIAPRFPSIQEAIDTARSIESLNLEMAFVVEIILQPGTYKGPSNRNLTFYGRPYLLRSVAGPDTCIIDCEGAGRGFNFTSGETGGARISGLTITNGLAEYGGGGIACENGSSPTFYNCKILGNTGAIVGGGVYCDNSSPTFDRCEISENNTGYDGGGGYFIHHSNPVIRNSIVRKNSAGMWGGGLNFSYYCTPTILDCLITQNTCGHVGGGIHYQDSHATIKRCVVMGNTSENPGGGIACHLSHHSIISDSLIAGNTALNYDAGGITSSNCTDFVVKNCTIVNNTAPASGGLHAWGGYLAIENCILWDNLPTDIGAGAYSELTIKNSNVEGGKDSILGDVVAIWGDGNLNENPLFLDSEGYRLSSASPCINAGDPNFVSSPEGTDLDGHARVLCGRVDMGAYEFGIGDFNCDQVITLADLAGLPSCEVNQDAPYQSGCEALDFEYDGDLDLMDFAAWQNLFGD